ncbi:hypothetical protein EVAR_23300_1 [Eumeta japonica]|uniref:Uncharacterized protein n=1 Tax=Eumeta variegata TaxID=151549 RepID=A0A4C1V548_EUMVA|nr:hypothetical protein EVAR_23300_1 [Eumeta japonica]
MVVASVRGFNQLVACIRFDRTKRAFDDRRHQRVIHHRGNVDILSKTMTMDLTMVEYGGARPPSALGGRAPSGGGGRRRSRSPHCATSLALVRFGCDVNATASAPRRQLAGCDRVAFQFSLCTANIKLGCKCEPR